MYIKRIDTPVGALTAIADDIGLRELSIGPREDLSADTDEFPFPVESQLAEYFAHRRTEFTIPLHMDGTPFQLSVWEQLRAIPYGETITYAELARRIGNPNAFRAVGGANGRNPVPIIVPCHRVVAANGLGGYSGGLEIKRALLKLEGSLSELI